MAPAGQVRTAAQHLLAAYCGGVSQDLGNPAQDLFLDQAIANDIKVWSSSSRKLPSARPESPNSGRRSCPAPCHCYAGQSGRGLSNLIGRAIAGVLTASRPRKIISPAAIRVAREPYSLHRPRLVLGLPRCAGRGVQRLARGLNPTLLVNRPSMETDVMNKLAAACWPPRRSP